MRDDGVLLRVAGLPDARAIAEFQTRSWEHAYRGLVPQDYLERTTVEVRELRWRQRLAPPDRRVALAVLGSAILGVISWGCDPELELKTLYVDAAAHGTGLAGTLMAWAIGDSPAHLWVFEQNERARAFYTKQRFAPDGGRMRDPDTGIWEIRMVRR